MTFSRRDFVRAGLTCSGYLAAAGFALPASARRAFAQRTRGRVVARSAFARIEELAEGVYAVVSTPLADGDFTTGSNGGLIVGRDGVLAIEGLATPEGARWVGDFAEDTFGRRPTHVVLSHHHGDHSAGQAGYRDVGSDLRVMGTAETRRILEDGENGPDLLPEAVIRDGETGTTVDLGGRTVRLTARDGHTRSDVTVEVEDPRIVWCGDLVWTHMFPNYVHATPRRLIAAVRATLSDDRATYVPGHGDIDDWDVLQDYVEVLELVGDAARVAHAAGRPAEEAAAEFVIPVSLGEWVPFSSRYHRVAFEAWYRDLDGEG